MKITNHKNMDEEKHTAQEWDKCINDLRSSVVNIPEWVYYHFLESVPPIYLKEGFGWLNSEPLTHNKEGEPVYYYFFKHNKEFYGTISSLKTYEFAHKLVMESLNEVTTCKL